MCVKMLLPLCNKFSNNMPEKNIYSKIIRVSCVFFMFSFTISWEFVLFFFEMTFMSAISLSLLFSFLDYHNPLALRFIFSSGYLTIYDITRFIKFTLRLVFFGLFFIAFTCSFATWLYHLYNFQFLNV